MPALIKLLLLLCYRYGDARNQRTKNHGVGRRRALCEALRSAEERGVARRVDLRTLMGWTLKIVFFCCRPDTLWFGRRTSTCGDALESSPNITIEFCSGRRRDESAPSELLPLLPPRGTELLVRSDCCITW